MQSCKKGNLLPLHHPRTIWAMGAADTAAVPMALVPPSGTVLANKQ